MSRNFDLLAEVEQERKNDGNEIRTPASAERQRAPEIISGEPEDSGGAEMLRLVQNVFLSGNGGALRQVVFCSVDDEISSQVCAHAGRTLAAHSSKPVCLVDANLRSRRLSHLVGADNTIPFSSKSVNVREACVQIGSNLWFTGNALLADGRGALLGADEIKHRLTQLDGGFEYILIDAPAALLSRDAAILGQVTDGAILVIEAGRTRRLKAGKAKELFDSAGVNMVGTVLHNRLFPIPEGLYKRL